MAVPRGSDRCTYYHVTGGPTQRTGYSLMIQANKRVDSFGIQSKNFVGTIAQSDINKLRSSAQRAPLQQCQRWVCDVLADLERKGLIEQGTAAGYYAIIEPSADEHACSS
jgi:hypothetical protein